MCSGTAWPRTPGSALLGRNVGEVLGVFGHFQIPDNPASRLRLVGPGAEPARHREEPRHALVAEVAEGLPEINEELRAKGERIYKMERCDSRHVVDGFSRTDPKRTIVAKMQAVGTEDRMAVNFAKRFSATGKLEGAFVKLFGLSLAGSPKFGKKADAEAVLFTS
ncbi:MAG: hypothetical protein WKF75_00770 [Singulisphaera sp.]